jgi:hypothetical protein
MSGSPITTFECGVFHFEYRTCPEIAIKEENKFIRGAR